MATVTELQVKVTANTKDAEKGLEDVSEKVEDTVKKGKKLDGIFDNIKTGALESIGRKVTDIFSNAIGAVVQFGAESIKAAGDFEAGLNRFASVAGSSLKQAGYSLDDVKKKALDMGAATQFSAAQAEQAMIELVKGGVPVADVMNKATDATLDLAAAGEVELANAATIVAKQLGVWGEEGVTAVEVSNMLAQSANASTVDVEELALGLSQVGSVAREAGLNFRETNQVMALIAPAFSSASDAGTSLKAFLNNLIPTTEDAKQKMVELGLATRDGKTVFYDAAGAFVGMEEAARLLHEATAGLSEEEKSLALETIFLSDGQRAAAEIARAGKDAYNEMGVAMDGAGSAAEQAAQRNKGFNFALETLMGSVETLKIVLGTALLPVLTSIIQNGLIPLVNGMMELGPTVTSIADTISTLLVPVLAGVTAAMIAYGIAQASAMGLTTLNGIGMALGLLAQRLTMVAGTAMASAKAMALAALPYAAIAAAIGVVVLKYNEFSNKVKEATQQVLSSKQFWTDSASAIENYASKTGDAKNSLAPLAGTIEVLRGQIEEEVEWLGKRMAAGEVSEEQYKSEMALINQQAAGLAAATAEYNKQEQAILQQQAAAMTGTAALAEIRDGERELGEQTALTAEDLKKLGDQIKKTFEEGAQAVGAYVATEIGYLASVETEQAAHGERMAALQKDRAKATTDEQRAAIDERIAQEQEAYATQQQNAALAYAEQQAAQKAHLGQMLVDYTLTQMQMGNISREQASAITAGIEREFGIQSDISARTFLEMTGQIDAFAASGVTDLNTIANQLGSTADSAITTKQRMDELAKQYTATLVHNFNEGKISAEQLAEGLKSIPSKVYSEIIITQSVVGGYSGDHSSGGGISGHRAKGGPVQRGKTYVVGEKGPELFTANRSGDILPNDVMNSIGSNFGGGRGNKGGNPLSQIAQSIKSAVPQVIATVKRAGQAISSAMGEAFNFSSANQEISAAMNETAQITAQGAEKIKSSFIVNLSEGASPETASVLDSIFGQVTEWQDQMAGEAAANTEIGQGVSAGVMQGLEASWPAVEGMAAQKAMDLLSAAKSALGISSPSKLFDEEFGIAIPQGAAAGIERGTPIALDAIKEMSSQLIKEAFDAQAQMARAKAANVRDVADLTPQEELDKLDSAIAHAEKKLAKARGPKEIAHVQKDLNRLLERRAAILAIVGKAQNDLASAEQRANELSQIDANLAVDYYEMRSKQILELANLEEEKRQAKTDAEKARIQAEIDLIKAAHDAELASFEQTIEATAQKAQEELQQVLNDLADRARDFMKESLSGLAGLARGRADVRRAIQEMLPDPAKVTDLQDKLKALTEEQARLEYTAANNDSADKREAAAERLREIAEERAKLEGELTAEQKEQARKTAIAKRAQEELAKAEQQALLMRKNDPKQADEWFDLQSKHILEIAELEQERSEARTDAERAAIDERIALIKEAQKAEMEQFQMEAQERNDDVRDLLSEINDAIIEFGQVFLDAINQGIEAVKKIPDTGRIDDGDDPPPVYGRPGSQGLALASASPNAPASQNAHGDTFVIDARGSNWTEDKFKKVVNDVLDERARRAAGRGRTL